MQRMVCATEDGCPQQVLLGSLQGRRAARFETLGIGLFFCDYSSIVRYVRYTRGLMRIETVTIAKLTPANYNPRQDLKPGDGAYEKLVRSLEEYGYVQPLVW